MGATSHESRITTVDPSSPRPPLEGLEGEGGPWCAQHLSQISILLSLRSLFSFSAPSALKILIWSLIWVSSEAHLDAPPHPMKA